MDSRYIQFPYRKEIIMLLELKKEIIYGPVHSRRLGPSLGLNILPPQKKTCTYNCLYCQYGWTDFSSEKGSFPSPEEVFSSLKKTLETLDEKPNAITFSGNGEPTLHPKFAQIVDGVIRLRDLYAPQSRTAILSNSSTATRAHIQAALQSLDMRIMKMETGNQTFLENFNQPAPSFRFDRIVKGLSALPNITLQALFTKGPKGNSLEENITAWIEALQIIQPSFVQIYTLDRDCPSTSIEKMEINELSEIRERLVNTGIQSDIFV